MEDEGEKPKVSRRGFIGGLFTMLGIGTLGIAVHEGTQLPSSPAEAPTPIPFKSAATTPTSIPPQPVGSIPTLRPEGPLLNVPNAPFSTPTATPGVGTPTATIPDAKYMGAVDVKNGNLVYKGTDEALTDPAILAQAKADQEFLDANRKIVNRNQAAQNPPFPTSTPGVYSTEIPTPIGTRFPTETPTLNQAATATANNTPTPDRTKMAIPQNERLPTQPQTPLNKP